MEFSCLEATDAENEIRFGSTVRTVWIKSSTTPLAIAEVEAFCRDKTCELDADGSSDAASSAFARRRASLARHLPAMLALRRATARAGCSRATLPHLFARELLRTGYFRLKDSSIVSTQKEV